MPYKNSQVTFCIYAWDAIAGVPKTGDSANITVRGIGDGTEFTPSAPNITEIDSTNAKGVYKVTFAASENNYTFVMCAGVSSTSGVSIQPVQWTNEITADAVKINGVSASSVTTISANIGTTQPVNFTGTGASALAKSDMVDIAGAAVTTSSAQIGVNVVNFGGSAGTFASGRPEVNTTLIEGVDATDQIRDSILSDATRFAGADIDATISSRLADASYTAPDNADIALIKAQTDQLSFDSGHVAADLRAVNGGSTGITAGKLGLSGLVIDATGLGDAAFQVIGDTDFTAINLIAAGNGKALSIASSGVSPTVELHSAGNSPTLHLLTDLAVPAVVVDSGDDAIKLVPTGSGKAINALGQIYVAPANTNDDALKLVPNGAGTGLNIQAASGGGINVTAALTAIYIEGQAGVDIAGDSGPAVLLEGALDQDVVTIKPAGTGKAIRATGSIRVEPTNTDDDALVLQGKNSGRGLFISSEDANGLEVYGNGAGGGNGDAIVLTPNGTGKAINALGQVNIAPTNTDDSALVLAPNGSGYSINAQGPVQMQSGTDNGAALQMFSANAPVIDMQTASDTNAVSIEGGVLIAQGFPNGDAITITPNGTGKAINAQGQVYVAPANTDDDALKLVGNGTGHSIDPATETEILNASLGTESYAADGDIPTQAQLLLMIYALLANFKYTGVNQSVKGLDKTTEVMQFSLDSDTTPTEHTRQS